ncbi:HipA domain-containing protein [Rhizobium indigoferae]|uniref:HipA domain-containing protein n=1 Tax=Rhizobium indigoferae TaxID=158891 RepID=A0ABZ1DMW2_9HYPH|nr:HipA domain-containing protein [Rhizobium indigoferae]NNU54957.1 type II toxin-antitoxin system HipA family toxin [Rhizobium indigoferae]WRW37572.1 HipA domain-containing protein [Rhizobium indigoferae]GLR60569.1 phosphatidylinositol kinase [Rhizobium indigoferae]
MEALALDVRLDTSADPVGVLVRDQRGGLAFAYSEAYVSQPGAISLSLSLPLTPEPFEEAVTRPFFDNLLQERDGALSDIMAREAIARDDIAGLLFHLGKDCAGALSVLPVGSPPTKVPGDYQKDYQPIEGDRLDAIVESLHKRRRLPAGTDDPSPLAGMQSKIALTVLPDGSLAEPVPSSGAPTTHILKVPDQDHIHDGSLEYEAMRLSQEIGFSTADVSLLPIAGVNVLLVTRFDRARDKDGRIVRIHQEDFAQALGLPSALKYERRGAPGRRFDVDAVRRILDATSDPAVERELFIQATLFDLFVGNVDAHAKNFALLHEPGGGISTSPRYDILPTRLDDTLTDELAYKIGDATTLDEIRKEDIDLFLKTVGIPSAAARQRLAKRYATEVANKLAGHLDRVGKGGQKPLADLIASNMRTLLGALDIEVPDPAKDRDAYIGRAGGWLLS